MRTLIILLSHWVLLFLFNLHVGSLGRPSRILHRVIIENYLLHICIDVAYVYNRKSPSWVVLILTILVIFIKSGGDFLNICLDLKVLAWGMQVFHFSCIRRTFKSSMPALIITLLVAVLYLSYITPSLVVLVHIFIFVDFFVNNLGSFAESMFISQLFLPFFFSLFTDSTAILEKEELFVLNLKLLKQIYIHFQYAYLDIFPLFLNL